MKARRLRILLPVLLWLAGAGAQAAEPIRVGSKNFNENYILAEMAAQVLEASGHRVERRFGLGGTLICYEALRSGEIDLYIEYTGTLAQAIFGLTGNLTTPALAAETRARGLQLLRPFGFDNTYALVMRREVATARGLARISDLRQAPDLRVVFSHEFLERADGWPGLQARYRLPQTPGGIEHALAYQALVDGAVDVTDAYSTDGELVQYDLLWLQDDADYFPEYLAVPLARSELPASAQAALAVLAGSLNEQRMQQLNARMLAGGVSFAEVARAHLVTLGFEAGGVTGRAWHDALGRNVLRHLQLTGAALALAVVLGVSLALLVYRRPFAARALVYVAGLLQTIPSIALLALMIPLFGIGVLPAILALFLYSLLPIVRNAVSALVTVDPTLVRVATAMGLSEREQLRHLYLPLAMPGLFAGIRTAAVISIGTATLAAFIGAGGLGDPIVTGLSLNDTGLILQGAVPAAVLAIVTELLFEWVERLFLPGHLRARAG